MSTMAPELPAERGESFASDLAGMGSFLIDPAGAARRVFSKWFWVGPLILMAAVTLITAYLMIPITQHVLENSNLNERQIEMSVRMQQIFMWFAPVMVAILFAISTLILFAMSSMTSVNTKFRELFNLVAGCSVIQMLAAIASVLILKAKGEVSSMAELRPALGLDIFLPEGTNRLLMAFLGYFSVFEIWWIVMMVLIYSKAFRTSKGKAFAVVLPLILLNLVFRVGGAAFQPK